MASWHIELSNRVKRDFHSIDPQYVPRILDAITALAQEPRPAASAKLAGHPNARRLRVGSFRVLYTIDVSAARIVILQVGSRSNIYTNWQHKPA